MDYTKFLESYRKHSWQPFTQMKLAPDPLQIERAEGCHLITSDGKRIIDAIGSWWTIIHGHNHPVIIDAIREQLGKLDHVIFGGMAHEPAVKLAEKLSATTGHRLTRAFYSDNGSTAVEIAIKMAYQFFANSGQLEKKRIVALKNGYHGDTIGAMSVGARSIFHEMYEPFLFHATLVSPPVIPFVQYKDQKVVEHSIQSSIQELSDHLEQFGEETFAVILEPLIQGASAGMSFYHPGYLVKVRELCDHHNVFLIADEVFTGFGRTGSMYAFEKAGVWPDLMALAKGLSGGVLPFAATLATEKIYEGFLSEDRSRTLFHGHSMTANPPGAAAALASLGLFESENRLEQIRKLEQRHSENMLSLYRGPLGEFLKEVRWMGSVAVAELAGEGMYTSDFGWELMRRCIQKGALIRPLGNSLYFTPPYTIQLEELDRVYEILEETTLEVIGS